MSFHKLIVQSHYIKDLIRVLMFYQNLLNELRKIDKMRGLPSILSIFHNEINKSIIQEHECLTLFII